MYVYTCHSVQWYRDDAVGVAFTVDSFVTATTQEVIGTWKKTKTKQHSQGVFHMELSSLPMAAHPMFIIPLYTVKRHFYVRQIHANLSKQALDKFM